MTKIIEIEGIGEVYAGKLDAIGITTIEALLHKGSDRRGREAVAEQAGISETWILEWVNRADLARINGVNTQYADLLEFAGVDTVVELAQRVAENLNTALVAVNKEKSLVRKLPGLSEVEDWIEQAKTLPRVVNY